MDEKDCRRLVPEYLPIFFDEVQFGTRLSSALRHFMARKENHYFFILVHHFYGTPILLGYQIFLGEEACLYKTFQVRMPFFDISKVKLHHSSLSTIILVHETS